MNTAKHPRKTAAANKAGKPKVQMNSVPSSGKELVVDSLGPLDPDALRADRAFRLHLEGRSIREIADLLGCSVGKAWQSVAAMSEALRDISTPEHRGAVRELLVRRYGKIYRQAEQCLGDAIEGLRGFGDGFEEGWGHGDSFFLAGMQSRITGAMFHASHKRTIRSYETKAFFGGSETVHRKA